MCKEQLLTAKSNIFLLCIFLKQKLGKKSNGKIYKNRQNLIKKEDADLIEAIEPQRTLIHFLNIVCLPRWFCWNECNHSFLIFFFYEIEY